MRINPATATALTPPWWPYSNNLKAAWVQFLTLRHGGSGYLFGYGLGAVGQNSAVAPVYSAAGNPDHPHKQSVGDGHTGGAAVPFAVVSRHQLHADAAGRAAALVLHEPGAQHGGDDCSTPKGDTIYYAGDPGVRNPTMFSSYPTATYPGTLPVGPTDGGRDPRTRTTPWGVPISRRIRRRSRCGGYSRWPTRIGVVGRSVSVSRRSARHDATGPVTTLTARLLPGRGDRERAEQREHLGRSLPQQHEAG